MPETVEGSPPDFKAERMAHFFELIRDKMPYFDDIPVEDDADGAAALIGVIVFAQERLDNKWSILGHHLSNYLSGMSPLEMSDSANELKSFLLRENEPNRSSAHLNLNQNNVEAMLERSTDFLVGHLRKRRYGRDLQIPSKKHGPILEVSEVAATTELSKKRGAAKGTALRYGAILGFDNQEQLGLYTVLAHGYQGPLNRKEKMAIRMILTAGHNLFDKVEWTEEEEKRVLDLLMGQLTLEQQISQNPPEKRRGGGRSTTQQELLSGLHKLADTIQTSLRQKGRR